MVASDLILHDYHTPPMQETTKDTNIISIEQELVAAVTVGTLKHGHQVAFAASILVHLSVTTHCSAFLRISVCEHAVLFLRQSDTLALAFAKCCLQLDPNKWP